MAVDLSDLVELLISEVNVPGGDAFPGAADEEWTNKLRNAFWETVLDGIVSGYTEDEGIVEPEDAGDEEFPRYLQQLVIFYAGVNIIRNKMHIVNSVFRAKAGPVEFETQQAATILKAVMDELIRKRNIILTRLSDSGQASPIYVDMVMAREESYAYGETDWVGY